MNDDSEIKAMASIKDALSDLDEKAIARVLRWAADRYNVFVGKEGSKKGNGDIKGNGGNGNGSAFQDFASLYNAANPQTDAEKALVVGYWFQEVKSQEALDAQQMNSELKHLGYPIGNITKALYDLISREPRLAIQVHKSGATKQARKKYKLTTEGIRKAKGMLENKPGSTE